MLKILADECVHKDLVEALKEEGFDVSDIREVEQGADDEKVFEFAVKEKRILLTFDREFGDIFRFDIKNSFGVVIILIAQLKKEEAIKNISAFFKSEVAKNSKGKLAIIGKKKVRIRSFL
jgi:predicted nuclease of predicted toxin-antitoxin system